jgi:DNA replication protein DnaC
MPAHRRDQVLADFATLRLPVSAEQLDAALQHAQDAGLSHLDFLHRLLSDQAGLRRQRSTERRIKDAHFRELKPLSEFDWNFNPSISRVQIETLAQGDFIRRRQNVVFVGQSGLGKSRLLQNIGQAACVLGYRVLYTTSGVLLEDLTAAATLSWGPLRRTPPTSSHAAGSTFSRAAPGCSCGRSSPPVASPAVISARRSLA